MLSIYSALHYLIMPLVLLRLLWRGIAAPAYRERWPERFGFRANAAPAADSGAPRIWIHAVSVGEVQAAVPLARALSSRYPEARILLTTTTPTGAARVAAAFGESVEHRYLPYDLPGSIRRFLDGAAPSLALFMETELWPNVLAACRRRAIPVLLVNARLSGKSARGYRRVAGITRRMLQNLSLIAAQGRADAERFIALGADPDRVRVTGSIKFDIELPANLREKGKSMRTYWGENRNVWIAASTHEGEEEPILDVFREIRKKIPDSLLILAARHPERFARTDALARRRGYRTFPRSRLPSPEESAQGRVDTAIDGRGIDVLIGDTMGELPLLYAAADVAFVGGSLISVGGHNMLEPAALGVPILFGPHVFNFHAIAGNLEQQGAARRVQNKTELAKAVIMLFRDDNLRRGMGKKGRTFVEDNRGALEQVMALVEAYLIRR
uniref:3-deoxy-D-manno-octulosonic acid transferase n=1 Tax=Candidatus Kentrum sp. DK TaxID=2126562 RepID=A0A450SU32_9GAMM|nr:MAG: 3-deoxy-D-manno-octulosonic-acid transferase [Candidatus Kentron sp. DK]VFJ57442.1 MAG: 3-deoxy-D-manno-octulosonic-acid transferase [Candidatus Kentron sp. DK]